MCVRRVVLSSFIALLLFTSAQAATITDVVNQVSEAQYTSVLNDQLYTHTGDNRGIGGAGHDPARTNIRDAFMADGLTTSLEPFTYDSATYYNVVGVMTGQTRPNDVYVIGAHYDSADNPGADDNASGTAGVMEAARVLSQYRFDASIIFVAFDREEKGLIGSSAYVASHTGQQIMGMISLDMIAYNPAGSQHDKAYIYGRDASSTIKSALASAMSAYGGGIASEIGGDTPYSDHAPFEAAGFQACLLIEHAVWNNPYYHGGSDSVDTSNYIDYAYATDMTRSVVGWAATEAVLVPEPGTCILLLSVAAIGLLRRRRRKGN